MLNVTGTEVNGIGDPSNMFIIIGVVLGIGVLVAIGFSIYMFLNK